MLVFAIINSVPRGTGATREWRNRQTRTFEGRVVIPYGFKSRLSHQEDSFIGILFLLRRSTHFEPSSAAPPCKNKEHIYAGMAELADALDSGSNGRKAVQVQVLLPAPIAESLEIVDNQRFRGFFFLYFILGKFREKRLKSRKNIKNASQMQVKNISHSQVVGKLPAS